MAKPNAQRLMALTRLRREAGLSLSEMARRCGLQGKQSHQTAGAWERGGYVPSPRRRPRMIGYLWDDLQLRNAPETFEAVWAILEEEWGWDPISNEEWASFTSQPRPLPAGDQREAIQPAPFQAPAAIPHFVGREEDIQQVCHALGQERSEAIALVGMGGIGKTAIAVHVAHTLRAQFMDGVFWANAMIAAPLDIAQSWARASGYDFRDLPDIESRAAAIRAVLADKQALVIIDDAVDVTGIRALLPSGARCRVLLTTRSHDVAAGLNARIVPIGELHATQGVSLLRRVLGPERIAAGEEAAQAICSLVEGLPLAVEIIAQRLNSRRDQPLSDMLAQLRNASERLDALHISDRAVRAAFEVSWTQLHDGLRTLFACTGVFEGAPFTARALAYMVAATETSATNLLWELQALSLMSKAEEPNRFRQHALLADFAREKIEDDSLYLTRMIEFYQLFLREKGEDDLLPAEEWRNVMFAMHAAARRNCWAAVLGYTALLASRWLTQAEYDRARQGYALAAEAARQLDAEDQLTQVLIGWGDICYAQNKFDESGKYLRQGLTLARQRRDQLHTAQAQYYLARLALQQGVHEETDQRLTDSLTAYRAAGDICGESKVQALRAELLFQIGEYDEAIALCSQARQTQAQCGSAFDLIETLQILVNIGFAQRDYQQAERYLDELRGELETRNLVAKGGECYLSLATLNRYRKEWEKAWKWSEKSRIISEKTGRRVWLARTLYEQAIIRTEMGMTAEGLALGEESLAIMTELRDQYSCVICMKVLGDFYLRAGKRDRAEALWIRGKRLAQSLQHPITRQFDERLNAPASTDHVNSG
ncbi:MAG: hypothetical protein H6642_01810 [Caldilineaceae bacterium]|nr:hypothetical protein [Caldilineaceae bacterium]